MAHTPGPWVAHGDLIYTSEQDLPAVNYVAKAFTPDNARLIAAAPDLLEACQQIANAHDNGWRILDAIALARSAATKATGTPAGWTHAETSAPDDPTQQRPASWGLRFQKSHAGQSHYQLLDDQGSLVALLSVMVPEAAPAVATHLNRALAAQPKED